MNHGFKATFPTAMGVAFFVGAYVVMGLTSASAWALFGTSLRHVMSDPRYNRAFNISLALFLVASIVTISYH